MRIAAAELHLRLHGVQNLKDKRRIIRSLTERLRQRFTLSVAEVGDHELWGNAVLGLTCVGTDPVFLRAHIEKAVEFVAADASVEVVEQVIEVASFPLTSF